DCWLLNLGMKTLPIRVEKHCTNAMAVAKFLETHPKVERVYYPGLPSHPHHELAKKQMRGFGGMISFDIKGGYASAQKMMDNCHIFSIAVSLGCVDSLIQHPASMTHSGMSPEALAAAHIGAGLIRLSVGIEDVDDIIKDLDHALKMS
ncbi:methionine gamma-lyase, partial [candidate division KSB1 bacterium]